MIEKNSQSFSFPPKISHLKSPKKKKTIENITDKQT